MTVFTAQYPPAVPIWQPWHFHSGNTNTELLQWHTSTSCNTTGSRTTGKNTFLEKDYEMSWAIPRRAYSGSPLFSVLISAGDRRYYLVALLVRTMAGKREPVVAAVETVGSPVGPGRSEAGLS